MYICTQYESLPFNQLNVNLKVWKNGLLVDWIELIHPVVFLSVAMKIIRISQFERVPLSKTDRHDVV